VENGQRAVEAFQADTFDLILMDVQMPVLDGFAATAAIRKLQAKSGTHTPIVAMTAHAMKGDRERCLAAGMDDYVSKPFRPHELFGIVERIESIAHEDRLSSQATSSSFAVSEIAETTTTGQGSPAFNRDEALRNVGGSDTILAEMVQLFISECPKQMADVAAAYESGDHTALTRAAHTLKGSLTLFAAEEAGAAARRIEFIGREQKLDEYPQAWAELQQHVDELLQAILALESANPVVP
jgi:CheY-like chemotaxis protein